MAGRDGALGIALFDDQYVQDPYPLYERMHAKGPVHRIGDSDFYAVTGWAAVDEAVTRCADFSSNLTATMMRGADGSVDTFPMGELGGPTQALATADDPVHATHRKALIPHLAVRRVRAVEPFIAETAAHLWHHGVRDGCVEWMGAMANRLPMLVVGGIIGIPDRDVEELVEWGCAATQFVEALVGEEQLTAAGRAVAELGAYITERFRHATENPRDDLLGDLARARAAGELDEVAAQVMLITLFSAGGESTASLIGSAAWILASRPAIQRQVRDRPELLGAFLEEVLRFEPPFRGHYRHVVRDTELGGVALPAGSRLLLMWGAANRDPSHVDDPGVFRLDRSGDRGHLAFGRGAHFCVGAALARLEATVVLGQLLQRTTWVDAAQTGRWLPSLLVRRLEHLHLALT